jgi:hypothetical protein
MLGMGRGEACFDPVAGSVKRGIGCLLDAGDFA